MQTLVGTLVRRIAARLTADGVVELRQVCTFGLGVIKDEYGPEAEGGLLSDSCSASSLLRR